MISHSVTGHPAEVIFQPLPPAKLVLVLATPEGSKAESTATNEHNLNVTLIVIERSEPLRSCHAFFHYDNVVQAVMMRKCIFKSIPFKLIPVSFWVFNVVAEN